MQFLYGLTQVRMELGPRPPLCGFPEGKAGGGGAKGQVKEWKKVARLLSLLFLWYIT